MTTQIDHRAIADRFVAERLRDRQVELRYDASSVAWVAEYLETLRENTELVRLTLLLASVAAFLGETVIALHGGKWQPVEDEWVVRLPNGCVVQPLTSVEAQVEWGRDASISRYLDRLSTILNGDVEWDLQFL